MHLIGLIVCIVCWYEKRLRDQSNAEMGYSMQQFICQNVRVQILDENIIHIEKSLDGQFCDENTFFVPNKTQLATKVEKNCSVAKQDENQIVYGDYLLTIPFDGLDGAFLTYCGELVYKYEKLPNSGELPKPADTPHVFALSDCPRIVEPSNGYTAKQDDPSYKVVEDCEDVYLLLCQGDHKKLRQLFVDLTGKCELVRLATLGNWNSKYFPYTQDEAKQVILDYQRYDVPLDNFVVDTDWRTSKDGWGYDINTELFPNMQEFFEFAHKNGVEVMFNDHPEPYQENHVFERDEIDYREKNLQKLLELGLDVWWYDRNWVTHLISPTKDIRWETLGMYVFAQITKNYYQQIATDKKYARRPVIMANVNNIVNGSYQSIADSASHRYSIQWTGDIMSESSSIGQEVANLVKAGENCIGYVHPDCGGHVGNPDDKLFVQWMQFGALCPILRPHCCNNVERFREPWLYGEWAFDIIRKYVKLRYRLLPTIYAEAYKNHISGSPIFPSLGYNYPHDEAAGACLNEYMLGKNLLIAPICDDFPQIVPKECYVEAVDAKFYDGRELKGEALAHVTMDKLSMQLNHVSPIEGVPIYDFSAKFETSVKFGKKTKLILCCDDGATVKIDGELVLRDDTLHGAKNFDLAIFEADTAHKIEIEYFQAGGEAACILMYQEVKNKAKEIYFPKGKWIDLHDGSEHLNGFLSYNGDGWQMPMFARAGAVVAVARDANNTKEQLWDELTLHYFVDEDATDEGVLYEDDGETVAYKQGEYRQTKYKAFYDASSRSYNLHIEKAEGSFVGERAFTSRKINVVVHLGGANISSATVNGAKTDILTAEKDSTAMPFAFDGGASDSRTITVSFDADVYQDYCIAFHK